MDSQWLILARTKMNFKDSEEERIIRQTDSNLCVGRRTEKLTRRTYEKESKQAGRNEERKLKQSSIG